MNLSKVWVVIPAYNEEKAVGRIIDDLQEEGFSNLLIVDDGSTDKTASVAGGRGTIVLSHLINLGAGAATRTGFDFVKKYHFEAQVVVTCDADGQHLASDVRRASEIVSSEDVDLVIGSRLLESRTEVPLDRFLAGTL